MDEEPPRTSRNDPQVGEEFREIADEAPAILWVTDSTGLCTYLNREWYSFTGQGRLEALGYGWTSAVHPEDRDSSTRTFMDALARRAPFQLEYRLRRHDGVYRYAVDAGRPRFDADGKFRGHVGIVLDITERKELERALFQSQKMEAIGRLAGGIAHDFNNLLTAISGNAHLVAEAVRDNAEALQDLREVEFAVRRASELTTRLLAFSRQQVLRTDVVDLNDAVRGAERMFSRIIGEDIQLRVQLADDLPPLRADRTQIDQVILNLLVNARDAMPGGGVLEITTSASHPPAGADAAHAHWISLTVRDTGVGMTEATQQHLFEPFFTTKAGGTGLGLATVYGIVRQSDGDIQVESQVGQGTSVTVRFPATTGRPQAETPPDRIESRGVGKLLLVEDEPAVRELAARTLRRAGYEVIAVGTAEEAKKVVAEHPDLRLVITDVVMPGGNGLELARHVTSLGRPTRVMLISGYAGDEMVRRGLSNQEYAFVQKPFTPLELARAVSDVLA